MSRFVTERRRVVHLGAAVFGGLFTGAVLLAGPDAGATTFVMDAAEARLICMGEATRTLHRENHTIVVPSDGPATLAHCSLEIDFRFRGGNGPIAVRRQWAERGFVEIMYLRDEAPMDPHRLLFKDGHAGITSQPLDGERGYRVRLALDRLFMQGGAQRVWILIGVRVRNGASEQGYYSVSQTIEMHGPGAATSSAMTAPPTE